ncbi:malectin/receptor-like kinase family protein [Medicago truncatula]|uniref:Malectin/receptor-like kinase family protein n=1 Tax=Medicago truncatula TaxID=3880 RepID=G7IG57_MEDTR|nr:malectin/receptor-like kinase family protein [Medicago truncatula]
MYAIYYLKVPASVFTAIFILSIVVGLLPGCRGRRPRRSASVPSHFITVTMDKFLNDMEKEKPIRFTDQQLRIATDNYSYRLGSGGFGVVYKGSLSDGTMIAVKVLHGSSDKRIDQQFMAEVGTIGKVHHFNLARLYGYCFEKNLIALVYEYMRNGSLDQIAIGTARGIAYLHEECQQRIIHYDIKPGNILLDTNFNPKVADFGLAKLCNRENTHITMSGGRGTPGYAAPELWMPFPVTHKCDVYSFGILLFEIIGRRRNHDVNLAESQEWFPIWVWKKFDAEQVNELVAACGIEEKNMEIVERMVKVALACVQYRPESRPKMSVVVQMLEGLVEISKPLNPFQYMIDGTSSYLSMPISQINTDTSIGSGSSVMVTESSVEGVTPIMTKYQVESASV